MKLTKTTFSIFVASMFVVINVAFNNLEAGTYDVAIFNMAGNKVFAKSITHNASTSVEQLSINNHLAAGTYTVHVTNANGVACQSQIEVK